MNDLIQTIFLYFARFPKFDAIAKSFNLGSTTIVSNYSDFKTQVDALVVKSLIPQIESYVFGVDHARVKSRIDSISGFYLLVDYGSIEAIVDARTGHTKNFLSISITVAYPINPDNMDDAVEILISSHCLNYLKQIKDRMKSDSRETLMKDLQSTYDAIPFAAPELNNSIGWTLTFTRDGVLL